MSDHEPTLDAMRDMVKRLRNRVLRLENQHDELGARLESFRDELAGLDEQVNQPERRVSS